MAEPPAEETSQQPTTPRRFKPNSNQIGESGSEEAIELDLTGKHKKEYLFRLLEQVLVHLKAVYLKSNTHMHDLLSNKTLTEEQEMQVRIYVAEEMCKSSFVRKTQEVLQE